MRLTRRPWEPDTPITTGPALPRSWAFGLVVGGLLLTFALDWTAGQAPTQHLYYLPIVLAGLRFGQIGGLAAAAAAVLLYHLANPALLSFRHQQADVLQVALFVIVGAVTAKLAHDRRRLRRLAMTDDLTGLHNLRSFESRLSAIVRASRGAGTPLALLVLDVDRLKELNDVHGHLAGAEAVRTVGAILAERLPPEAVACRYGGDEFVVALPRCTVFRANAIADGLRRAVHAASPVLDGVPFPAGTLTISVGVAGQPPDDRVSGTASGSDAESGEALFRAADAALYAAKASGRNRVSVA